MRGSRVEWIGGAAPDGVPTDQGTLAALEALLERYRAPVIAELPPFHGGIVGWLGYDTVREIERLPGVPPDDLGFPDAVLCLAGQVAAFDHFRQRLYLIENVYPPPGCDARRRSSRLYEQRVRAARRRGRRPRAAVAVPARAAAGRRARRSCPRCGAQPRRTQWTRSRSRPRKEHILEGDIFQVVLAQRFDLVEPVDPFAMYRVLRLVNPSPYMYFLRHPEATIVGSSPEPMVQLLGGRVISRPIAGTRRRGRTEEHDRRMAAELVEHPKERAEHVMLVDLARNDVGRVVHVRHRAGRGADDARALLARDAPHEPGRRAISPRARARSTCCARRSRPAR